jgi:hypothetical protein
MDGRFPENPNLYQRNRARDSTLWLVSRADEKREIIAEIKPEPGFAPHGHALGLGDSLNGLPVTCSPPDFKCSSQNQ